MRKRKRKNLLNEEYKDFKRLVISRCGKIEGIDEYCESNNWE